MDKNIDYKKLKDARIDSGMKQKEIAASLNIEQPHYSKMENGKRGIRFEQAKIIADMLGKNINEFLTGNNDNSSSKNTLKMENEFLKSMLSLYSANIDSELFGLMHSYDNRYPEYQLPYHDFLKDGHSNPEAAIEEIKQALIDYEQTGMYPAFYGDLPGGIEYLRDKDDKWLNDFVRKEENYDLIFVIIGCPTFQEKEDIMLAFKDMLKENPLIHGFFQYGLLEKSYFAIWWDQYLEDGKLTLTGDGARPILSNPWPVRKTGGMGYENPNIDLEETSRKKEERENIRKKMRSVLVDQYQ